MQLTIEPTEWSCITGSASTPDAVVRSLLNHQTRSTGADLMSQRLSDDVRKMIADGVVTTRIATHVINSIQAQIHPSGGITAALDPGAKREPFHDYPWHKQGNTAAVAIFAAYVGDTILALRIVDYLVREQHPASASRLRIPGLFSMGTTAYKWPGDWAWVSEFQTGVEDCTNLYELLVFRSFGLFPEADAVLRGLREVYDENGGWLPEQFTLNNGMPTTGRNIVIPAYSVDLTARFVQLSRAIRDDPYIFRGAVERINEYRTPDGRWFPYVCPRTLRAVYPKGDPEKAYKAGIGRGEPTYDYNEAVRGGYRDPTNWPAWIQP